MICEEDGAEDGADPKGTADLDAVRHAVWRHVRDLVSSRGGCADCVGGRRACDGERDAGGSACGCVWVVVT